MKKYDITTLSKLKNKDRFYFSKNKKLLCTFIGAFENYYSYKNDNGTIIDEPKDKRVIYLRNIND